MKFFISITQWHRTKLRAIVWNTNYFKPIILKFKTFIYNSNIKIMYNFCMHGGNTPPIGGEVTPWGGWYFPHYGGSIAPMHTKIIYDLTITNINKGFEFQNNWLKTTRIRYNCTQFCPIPLC